MKQRQYLDRRQFLRAGFAGGSLLASNPLLAVLDDTASMAAARARDIAGSRKIVLRLLLPGGSESNVLPVARAFEAESGIGFDLTTTPVDDINSHLLLGRLTGKRQYDLALPATYGIPDLVEAGAIASLDNYAARYEPAAFREQSLYNVGDTYRGQLYGYQADGDVYLMFYNASFLADEQNQRRYEDQFGRPLAAPLSWPELDRQLQFFNRPDAGIYGGALFRTPRYIAWEWWMRLHSMGVLPFDDEMRPQTASEAGVAALEDLTRASQHLCPGCQTNDLFQNWKAYAEGNIFCNIGWGGSQKYFMQHSAAFTSGLLYNHLPGEENRDGNSASFFNWGWNYAVPYNSSEAEIAYLFSLFASSGDMSTLAVRQSGGFFDPFREEHYIDPEIESVYSKSFLQAHRQAMRSAIPDFYLRGQSDYIAILSDYIIKADRRQMTPYAAMEAVSRLWEETTRQFGRDEQIRQWRALRDKYPASFTRA